MEKLFPRHFRDFVHVELILSEEQQMNDVFRAGVEPGGLTMDFEIKILICYLLYKIEQPFPVNTLTEVFVQEGIGNYFETASAASNLLKSGHIKSTTIADERCYVITELGASASAMFEKKLPLSIREKAMEACLRNINVRKRNEQNKTEIKKVEDGYLLTLTITDVGSNLLSVTLLVPDQKYCEMIRDRFLKDPVLVYKGVVASLTGSFESVGELLTSGDATVL